MSSAAISYKNLNRNSLRRRDFVYGVPAALVSRQEEDSNRKSFDEFEAFPLPEIRNGLTELENLGRVTIEDQIVNGRNVCSVRGPEPQSALFRIQSASPQAPSVLAMQDLVAPDGGGGGGDVLSQWGGQKYYFRKSPNSIRVYDEASGAQIAYIKRTYNVLGKKKVRLLQMGDSAIVLRRHHKKSFRGSSLVTEYDICIDGIPSGTVTKKRVGNKMVFDLVFPANATLRQKVLIVAATSLLGRSDMSAHLAVACALFFIGVMALIII